MDKFLDCHNYHESLHSQYLSVQDLHHTSLQNFQSRYPMQQSYRHCSRLEYPSSLL